MPVSLMGPTSRREIVVTTKPQVLKTIGALTTGARRFTEAKEAKDVDCKSPQADVQFL